MGLNGLRLPAAIPPISTISNDLYLTYDTADGPQRARFGYLLLSLLYYC